MTLPYLGSASTVKAVAFSQIFFRLIIGLLYIILQMFKCSQKGSFSITLTVTVWFWWRVGLQGAFCKAIKPVWCLWAFLLGIHCMHNRMGGGDHRNAHRVYVTSVITRVLGKDKNKVIIPPHTHTHHILSMHTHTHTHVQMHTHTPF